MYKYKDIFRIAQNIRNNYKPQIIKDLSIPGFVVIINILKIEKRSLSVMIFLWPLSINIDTQIYKIKIKESI